MSIFFTACHYRLALQEFLPAIPQGHLSFLAHSVVADIQMGRFEDARQLMASKSVFGPEQRTLLESLVTGVALASSRVIDPEKVTGCLRYFDRWIGEKEAVKFPDVILTRSTWGATEWTREERRSYFVDELGVYFRAKLAKAGFSPLQISKTAYNLGNFAEAGFENWPSDWPVTGSVVEAMNAYEISRRKGATNDEIAATAEAIGSIVWKESLSKLENTRRSEALKSLREQKELLELLKWRVSLKDSPTETRKPVYAVARGLFEELENAGYEPKSIIALAAELAAAAAKRLG